MSLDGAIAYLREHAIDQRIAAKYRLGFVAQPLPGDERFFGMLSIPYITPEGVRSIKYRNLSGGDVKYAQHKGQLGRPYNAQAYFDAAETIGIAEGEIDAIAATEHLKIPTLGIAGVEAWKKEWTSLLKDFTRVLLFGDGDKAGREFSAEMADMLGWRGQIVPMPDGEDVSSLAAAGWLDLVTTSIRGDDDDAE